MTEQDSKLVVVFIPAFNEGATIGKAIDMVRSLYPDDPGRDFRVSVLVVDDGSSDGTAGAAEAAGCDRLVSHPSNLGLGAATRTALRTAYEMGADVAVKLDADLQHDPADIAKVVRPILDDRADIVYGSRFAGEIRYKMPLIRKWGNLFFTFLMRQLTGWAISDAQTGMMVYSRRYLAVFAMPGDYNPPQQTLLDAYHKHMRYAEVPVVFNPRTEGESFVSLRYPFKVFLQMLRVLVLVNPLKVFVPIGVLSFLIGVVLGLVELVLVVSGRTDVVHDGAIVLFIVFGLQSLFFGLLADLIINKRSAR